MMGVTKMKFNKLFKRSILGDYDRDGVMNAFDCQPKNKRKQDSKKDKISKEFYGSKYKELSDEQKFDVKEGLKDNLSLIDDD